MEGVDNIRNLSGNFELSAEDMDRIKELDTGRTEIIDHLSVDIVKFLNQHKIHD